ncbi:hypothetical protein C8A05DRAFT_38769 [Staphylotrichum tortipilum]|uniref:Uncharacterized protein n=1 Tax=Staphylotrichum tortipilum TaxID=2831512 RepID=A0AAN6MCX8_9PEZI|nr:hypothetical protein C8A05DRAFT_38769 [Staphylotrichum longicolle]
MAAPPNPPQPQPLTRAALLAAATSFCTTFSHPSPTLLTTLLTTHFTLDRPSILIHKHGQPSPLTPFLGVPFHGAGGGTTIVWITTPTTTTTIRSGTGKEGD